MGADEIENAKRRAIQEKALSTGPPASHGRHLAPGCINGSLRLGSKGLFVHRLFRTRRDWPLSIGTPVRASSPSLWAKGRAAARLVELRTTQKPACLRAICSRAKIIFYLNGNGDIV